MLKIPLSRLDEIQHTSLITCFQRILEEWLHGYDECTKKKLIMVLRSGSIRENRLAMEIELDEGI